VHALLEFLDNDTTFVTVNRRLARAVTEAYAERQVAEGERAWRTPDVIPFSAWVERSWRTCVEHRTEAHVSLLRSSQQRMLWEQVIRQHAPPGDDQDAPLAASAAARSAREAYALINAWRISVEAPEFGFSPESRAFRTWARAFDAQCANGGWIDPGRAACSLADSAGIQAAGLRRRAVFAGFDLMTPQQQAIRAALGRCGVEVIDAAPPQRQAQVSHRAFDDPAGELRAAALWAREKLIQGPQTRIGIVVPELHRMRPMVERIFDELLTPGAAMPEQGAVGRQFNLSYGEPVSRVPLVGDGLIALKLSGRRVELAEAGRLLRSPYFAGGNTGFPRRARVDADLRDSGEPEVSLDLLLARCGRDEDLRSTLQNLVVLRSGVPCSQPLKTWSAFFSGWLSQFGWPGERSPDSGEFQAVETFRGLLDEFAGMGAVAGPVGLDRALSLFLKLADEQLFQPRSGPVPVQILGVLETAGLVFDGLWITGLHDGSWPPAPEPDPFVPISLQRGAGVLTASPEGQLSLAKMRLEAWLRAADQVVLSYPKYDQDEPLRPSPLMGGAAFEHAAGEGSTTVDFSERLNREGVLLEAVSDERAPALAETRVSRGGAAVLRDQAACPFRAFARWRLDAKGVPIAASPMDVRIRGNLVHAVLNALWSKVDGLEKLNLLPLQELLQRISAAVDQALERERRARPETLRGTFAQIERERLCALMENWLSLEKRRAPFQVAARETEIEGSIGPLSFRIRPDRVDRLETGGHFLIDYKTGSTEVRRWFGERPDDPQLAVYSLVFESAVDGGPVAGAAYGAVRRDAPGFEGLADREGVAEGVSTLAGSRIKAAAEVPDWAALKLEWRDTLQSLAENFASGDARVDPKSPHTTCAYCEVMPLCRIFEQRLDDEDQGVEK